MLEERWWGLGREVRGEAHQGVRAQQCPLATRSPPCAVPSRRKQHVYMVGVRGRRSDRGRLSSPVQINQLFGRAQIVG